MYIVSSNPGHGQKLNVVDTLTNFLFCPNEQYGKGCSEGSVICRSSCASSSLMASASCDVDLFDYINKNDEREGGCGDDLMELMIPSVSTSGASATATDDSDAEGEVAQRALKVAKMRGSTSERLGYKCSSAAIRREFFDFRCPKGCPTGQRCLTGGIVTLESTQQRRTFNTQRETLQAVRAHVIGRLTDFCIMDGEVRCPHSLLSSFWPFTF
jgi:hypothetical protein